MSAAHYRQWLFYGLPGLPLAMLGLPLYVYLPSFYAQDLGLSLSVVGMALLAARGLDVITDPLIGWLNDKVQSTWGPAQVVYAAGLTVVTGGLGIFAAP